MAQREAPSAPASALGRREFAAVALGVAGVHAALLLLAGTAAELPAGVATARRTAHALQVRAFAAVRTPVADLAPPAALSRARPAAAPAIRPLAQVVAVAPALPQAPVRDAPAAPPAAAPLEGEVPIYRTLVPPGLAYGYDLRRGTDQGRLELHWRPDGQRYEAQLMGMLAGAPVLVLRSRGEFDAAGLAPQRHTDRRRGRSEQAANFEREAGRITLSGATTEQALPPGAQDGLSWMLQLAAIVAAEPALAGPGGQISLVVAGARGPAGLWTFVHAGVEPLPGAGTPLLHLRREPAHAYDTRAEVWLDPAMHYLPRRARLSNLPSGRDMLQIEWRESLDGQT